MAATRTKMICPKCGAEMNHHGDKLVYSTDPGEEGDVDSSSGGLMEEFHSCPRCGHNGSRRA